MNAVLSLLAGAVAGLTVLGELALASYHSAVLPAVRRGLSGDAFLE